MASQRNRIARGAGDQGNDVVPVDQSLVLTATEQDNELVLMRDDLREAIRIAEWKHEALAAEMSRASGLAIDGPYLSKILAGTKPLTAEHIAALPNEIEAIYNRLRAERSGQIVVQPLIGLDAQKALVAGLIGVMAAPQWPARGASPMAKAGLTAARKVVGQ